MLYYNWAMSIWINPVYPSSSSYFSPVLNDFPHCKYHARFFPLAGVKFSVSGVGHNTKFKWWKKYEGSDLDSNPDPPESAIRYLVPTIKPLWLSPMITPVDGQVYDLTLRLYQVTVDYSSLYLTFYLFYLTALSHRWCDLAPSSHFQPACLPPQFVESCLQGHLKQSMVGITANLLPCGCTSTFNFVMKTYLLNFNLFHSGYIIFQ